MLFKRCFAILLAFLVMFVSVTPASVFADELDTWNNRNPLPTGNRLAGVSYGNNTFVVVGDWGTILTSSDSSTWAKRSSVTEEDLHSVTYGNNTFVAVGSQGTILTSTDGITWALQSSGTTNALNRIGYYHNTFVAVGDQGTILTSTDGVTWTSRSSVTTKGLSDISYGNNTFVVVGYEGTILTSSDATAWILQKPAIVDGYSGISFDNNTFWVMGVNCTLQTSSDGEIWTKQSPDFGTRNFLFGIRHLSNLYVVVGAGVISTSSDGSTWSLQNIGTWNYLQDAIYANNTYVVVGTGTILTSKDGVNWTNQSKGTTEELDSVNYGNNTFVSVTSDGTILTSKDGSTWTLQNSGNTNSLSGVGYGNNTFVVVGDQGTILTSSDGATWTPQHSGTTNYLSSVRYGNNTFVAVGDQGTILTSSDGATWTPQHSSTTNYLSSVGYGNNTFVAVGDQGTILTSSDGVTWTSQTSGVTSDLIGVLYENNTFVAVGTNGTILTSSDGVTWASKTSGTGMDLFAVAYNNKNFVVVGRGGTILTSNDGTTWRSRGSGTTNDLYSVSYGNNTYLAVGQAGIILQSSPIAEQTYTVTYDGNGSDGGSVPSDSNKYQQGGQATVLDNTGKLTKTGYTFAGWNTQADGKGTDYAAASMLTMDTANVTLYAKWTANPTFAVTYDGNRSDGGSVPSDSNEYQQGGQATVLDNTGKLTKTGYTFAGWNTQADGKGTDYAAASKLTLGSANVTLYAKWTANPTFTVTYNGNGNSRGGVPSDNNKYEKGMKVTVLNNTGSLLKSGYTFSGWNTQADGKGTDYSPASTFNMGAANVTLFAKWTSSVINNSGGSGIVPPSNVGTLNNGQQVQMVTSTNTTQNGRNVLTVTVDTAQLNAQLAKEATTPTIVLPLSQNSDVVSIVLAGDAVKAMANKQAVLDIQTPTGNYKLPASELSIDRLQTQIGSQPSLSDLHVQINIAKSDSTKVALLNQSANQGQYSVVVPPVDFTVTASYQDKTVQVDKFNSYVQREIPLPTEVDPSKVTTAVVLNDDGTIHPVPTYVTVHDGKNYAVVNSLTNSTYALISHQTAFADVQGHWAQGAVNNMASRMVIRGVDENHFNPDAAITRAEFAAILVRALGLADNGKNATFADVHSNDWYVGAVAKAQKYGILSGYEDGTFRPTKTITRQEAMAMIARAMKLTGLDNSISNTDADAVLSQYHDHDTIGNWAKQAVAATVKNHLVQGSDKGQLLPQSNITRAETTVIVEHLLEQSKLITSTSSK
ncbi:putative repeat protein (TIGR02543 family) [Aneurinibacillus soli]|uniref:Endo-1,4-beta-xylanase A n=1 Tax=Aneurinibacillus soli TaxID=1500254 RepID=A0A0U4WBX6_9BACL|nr:InlB B-repeat-containing protein [Aneurinibacillus soli]PYE61253.1 putative repeat protein (TIGR02543 family) [Aneurinibacillus soli]BAU26313.1 Endo-1,4-beta-xylanase A precursor [Aneurinibacillus soli]